MTSFDPVKGELALSGIRDLCRCSAACFGGAVTETETLFYNGGIALPNVYSRLIPVLPERDKTLLAALPGLMDAPAPRRLTFTKESCYEGFYEDLLSLGFIPATPQTGMLYVPGEGDVPAPAHEVIAAEGGMLEEWCAACGEGFGTARPLPLYKAFLQSGGRFFFACREEGRIAATAMANLMGDSVSIHEVTTLKAYRGRGLATALISHILRFDYGRRINLFSLQASPLGRPVYARLGFVPVSTIINMKYGE